MVLSRSLYTHSLDINVGVIAALLDQALDEDVKEAILAYFVLLQAEEPLSSDDVRLRAEGFLQMHYDVAVKFEISDALTKLRKDGLVTKSNSNYHVVKAGQACDYLEKQWYDLYSATESLAEVLAES